MLRGWLGVQKSVLLFIPLKTQGPILLFTFFKASKPVLSKLTNLKSTDRTILLSLFNIFFQLPSVQFRSCPTLCDPIDCSTPGLPVHHQLPELAQTHVHWVSDAIQPSHSLSSPSPPTFNYLTLQQLPFQRMDPSGPHSEYILFDSLHSRGGLIAIIWGRWHSSSKWVQKGQGLCPQFIASGRPSQDLSLHVLTKSSW